MYFFLHLCMLNYRQPKTITVDAELGPTLVESENLHNADLSFSRKTIDNFGFRVMYIFPIYVKIDRQRKTNVDAELGPTVVGSQNQHNADIAVKLETDSYLWFCMTYNYLPSFKK